MFFFFFKHVVARNKEEKDKRIELLTFLDGEAFEFVNSRFTNGKVIRAEGSNFKKVKEALINEFEVQEEPQELIRRAMVAILDKKKLITSMEHMDAIFRNAELNEKCRLSLLRNCAIKIEELSAFTIHRSAKTHEDLKTIIRDFETGTKAYRFAIEFYIENQPKNENTRATNDTANKIVRTDSRKHRSTI